MRQFFYESNIIFYVENLQIKMGRIKNQNHFLFKTFDLLWKPLKVFEKTFFKKTIGTVFYICPSLMIVK